MIYYRSVQPDRAETIDEVAIFGKINNKKLDGRKGRWLEIKEPHSKEIIDQINATIAPIKKSLENEKIDQEKNIKTCL